jgi:CHAT domain-containing protein
LVLAAGATPRDWLLTASDAATLRIDADWVLLSACNTASPDGGGAEGLSGLVRGFFHAGASALLVSHWSVQDEAASRLIPRTLLLQRDGRVGRAEALRRASLELLDAPGGDFAHPFFWAPFTLVGDPF